MRFRNFLNSVTVAFVQRGDHGAVEYRERREQRRRAVAGVVVATALGRSRNHRQHRLEPVERLDLGLFVHREHHGVLGRVEVKTHDVSHLLDEKRIGRELEALLAPGLQSERTQIRPTVAGEIPTVLAKDRVDQWVASVGICSKVFTITSSTASSEMLRGARGAVRQ